MGNPIITRNKTSYRIHLILHKCNQWRNDNGSSLHDKGWKLVAQGLSASCRHKYKCIGSADKMHYDTLLISLK